MSELSYSWSIIKLEYITEENNLSDVIKTVYWTYTAQEVSGNQYTASCNNAYPLPTPSPDSFIDVSSLTEEQVIQWLESSLDVSVLQNNLANEISLKYNPPIVTDIFPWTPVQEIIESPVEPPVQEVIEPPAEPPA